MDNRTKALAIIVGAVMLLIPMSIMFVGVNVTNEGIDELNTLLVDYPGLADAIVKVSGGLTMVLFGCVAMLFFHIVLRSDHADRIEKRVEDSDDIEY